jgi:hypothetical protein
MPESMSAIIAAFCALSVPPDVRQLLTEPTCPAWRLDTRVRWDRETYEEERHHQWGIPTTEMRLLSR